MPRMPLGRDEDWAGGRKERERERREREERKKNRL